MHRRRARQHAHRVAVGIDLHLLEARGAVQVALVVLFEAALADMVRAFVVGKLAGLVQRLQIAIVDAADITDQVCAELALRIVAEQA